MSGNNEMFISNDKCSFSGSEGKLTLVGQKQSVLEAIGGFAVSGIGSGESPTSLASATTTMYLSFLQQVGPMV